MELLAQDWTRWLCGRTRLQQASWWRAHWRWRRTLAIDSKSSSVRLARPIRPVGASWALRDTARAASKLLDHWRVSNVNPEHWVVDVVAAGQRKHEMSTRTSASSPKAPSPRFPLWTRRPSNGHVSPPIAYKTLATAGQPSALPDCHSSMYYGVFFSYRRFSLESIMDRLLP